MLSSNRIFPKVYLSELSNLPQNVLYYHPLVQRNIAIPQEACNGMLLRLAIGVNLCRSTPQCIILEAEINLVVVLNTYELSKPILLFKVRNEQPYRLRARLLYNAFSLTAKLNLFHL